jgi:HEAT repeat protein
MTKASDNLICAALFLLMTPAVFAQLPGTSFGQPPMPAADALRARGIDLSRPSLIAALSNRDPQVRSLAAHQLVFNRDPGVIANIEKALSTETDRQARIGLASALASVGDPAGARHLEGMCMDTSLPVDVTVQVVQQLAMAQHSHPNLTSTAKCADVVLAAIESASESYQRRELVSLLPSMVHQVPEDKADRMVKDAQNLLGDGEPATRMGASDALAQMGSIASIEAVRDAIRNESDPVARRSYQRNLDTLQKLQQPQTGQLYGGTGEPMTSPADTLRRHGIDISEASLTAALKNGDPAVRMLAAAELSEKKDYQAKTAIETALSSETDVTARINIAGALIHLGDPAGQSSLEALCSDTTQPAQITIRATQQLAMAQASIQKPASTEKCADAILAIFDSSKSSFDRDSILTILPTMYRNTTKDKADRMIAIARSELGDGSQAIRMGASEALAEMGSTASIDLIRSAMQRETEPTIRSWYQRNLDTLQKLQQPQ